MTQLDFIESVISHYRESTERDFTKVPNSIEELEAKPISGENPASRSEKKSTTVEAQLLDSVVIEGEDSNLERRRTGIFGGGFLSRKPDPKKYEIKVVQQLRLQRKQNQIALRWIAIFIIIPLLFGLISRYLVFEPLLGSYIDKNPDKIELSSEIEEEFSEELARYRERLEVKSLLGLNSEISTEKKQELMADKAKELWKAAREEELQGLKNLLSDLVIGLTFSGLIFVNRNRLQVVRGVTNRTFLSLSDPAKVFLFILVTDMFVGFHSPEGWTVILNGIAHHFGLPENEAAVDLFIATVPVAMDSGIKFWIFNYLTRFSPSTSAVYERMNT
ncbi:MAG: CemA family protein [Cyanobacteria bacterium P01_H01_bin.15]